MGKLVTIEEAKGIEKPFIFDTCVLIDAYNELKKGEGPTKRYLDNIPRGRRTTTVVNLFEFAFIEDVSREEMGKCMRWLKDQDIRVLAFSKKASKTFQILSSIYKPPRNLLADMLIASIGLAEKKRDGVRSQRAVAQIKFFFLVSEFAVEKI